MILKYVLRNFRRRKVRTVLMVLSLMVSMGLLVAMSATVESIRRSNVDLISSAAGRYDMLINKVDTDPDPFIETQAVSDMITSADEQITAVYPRFVSTVEMITADNQQNNGYLLAIEPEENIGFIDVVSGTYTIGDGQAAVLQATATSFGLDVGDTLEIAYSFPQPREEGQPSPQGSSQRRATERFLITGIVRQNGVADLGVSDGLIVDVDDAREMLNLPEWASQLVVLVEPALYEAGNAEAAALSVRDIAVRVQALLGDNYQISLTKASALDQSAEAFLILQALINTYGIMALAVVGLLVHTLVMTNVQEQKREMAVLRILGSQRNYLFMMVIAEVLVIGAIGVGLGIVFGQIVTAYAVIPFIESQMSNQGLQTTIQPVVSATAILPALIAAFTVLVVSALKPAQDASKTKVMVAINPGVADNIQLEDLDQLRERRPTLRMFFVGLAMMFVVFMVIGFDLVGTFGIPAAEAAIFLTAILLMVIGVGLCFFILTRPLERFLLLIFSVITPRLTFFAQRNVGRGHARNTLISLLVLFSAVLPSFLATQSAISNANIETDVRLSAGAPLEVNAIGRFDVEEEIARLYRLSPSFIAEKLMPIVGVEAAVGLSYDYPTGVSDAVGMRSGSVTLVGVTGDLGDVVYEDLTIFTAGDRSAFSELMDDPNTIIVSEGLANGLAIPLGGTLKIEGEGLDHREEMTVVGVAQRVPGFSNIGRIRNQMMTGGTVFVSMEAFRRLTTDLNSALPPEDDPIMDRVLATIDEDADLTAVDVALHEQLSLEDGIWTRLVDVQLQNARDNRAQEQIFLLVLTLISFTTAVFGVFAVIYVTVYARRLEIGMMKAVGSRNWELTGMLIVEAIAMTLSAALAGIIAGATMGYLFAYLDSVTAQRPLQFAFDTTVVPFIVIMVVLASIIGAGFSARRIVKRKAVEILRMG